jgi:hypothetical protein
MLVALENSLFFPRPLFDDYLHQRGFLFKEVP